MYPKLVIYFCCCLALTGILFPLKAISKMLNLHFNHLTTNEGLSQSVIHRVYTDKKGFLWIATANGINRFDGVHCLSNNQIAPGLKNIAMTLNIVEDKNNNP